MSEVQAITSPMARLEAFEAFAARASTFDALARIRAECIPPGERTQRMKSETLLKELATHFDRGSGIGSNLFVSDLAWLRHVTIANLDVLHTRPELLESIRIIATAAHIPPFNTLCSWFSPINTAARKLFEDFDDCDDQTKKVRLYMRARKAESVPRGKLANRRMVDKNRDQINMNFARASHVVSRWSRSKDWRERLLAVMASCGARKTEILDKRIKFEEKTELGANWLLQLGVLKDRTQVFGSSDDGAVMLLSGKTVTKPVMFGHTSKDIINSIAMIRSQTNTDGLSRYQINQRYGNDLVLMVKEAFPSALAKNQRVGTHMLRSLYANVAYEYRDKSSENTSLTAYINEVLGHHKESINVALSYQYLNMDWTSKNDGPLEPFDGPVWSSYWDGGRKEATPAASPGDPKRTKAENTIASLQRQIVYLRDLKDPLIDMSTGRRLVVDITAPVTLSQAGGGGVETRDMLGAKRKRGVLAGASILLKTTANSWQAVTKPVITRGDDRRVPQMRQVIKEMLMAGIPMNRANLSRLGFGKERNLRGNMEKVVATILGDPSATDMEIEWSKVAFMSPPHMKPTRKTPM